jgi:hypothetical protein
MAMKKSINRTLAHIDVAATVPFAFTKTFSTPTPVLDSYLKTSPLDRLVVKIRPR